MKFTPSEVRFLAGPHAGMQPVPLDCPPHILQGILERRAKKLGSAFVRDVTPAPKDDLDVRVASSGLF